MSTSVLDPPKASPAPNSAGLQAVPLAGAMEIPLAQIVPSKTNRRTVRNAEADAEMVQSIIMRGVQQAIVVRPFTSPVHSNAGAQLETGNYEIVCGHRRYELSLRAGKTTIPAIVRKLNNAEALEIQNIENLQREDLDPLDRAEAIHDLYQQYLKAHTPKDAIAKIAARLNCKERTLYNMMSLRNLLPDVQKAIAQDEKISMSHGYVLATLSPDPQKRAWSWLKDQSQYRQVSVRNLQQYIQEQIFRRLAGAPWNLDDAKLVSVAGACSACPKNTAVNPLLSEEKKPTCTDLACYEVKQQAYLLQAANEAKKEAPDGKVLMVAGEYGRTLLKDVIERGNWKESKPDSCSHTVLALIATGPSAGKKQYVCITRTCSKHWERWERPYAGVSSRSSSGGGLSDEEKKRRLKEQRDRQLEAAYRAKLIAAIGEKVTDLTIHDLRDIAAVMFQGLDHSFKAPVFEAMGWKVPGDVYGRGYDTAVRKTLAEAKVGPLGAFVSVMAFASDVVPGIPKYYQGRGDVDVKAFAKRHKIDLEKIKAQAEAPLKAKFKAIDERKKKAETSASTTSTKSTKSKARLSKKKAAKGKAA